MLKAHASPALMGTRHSACSRAPLAVQRSPARSVSSSSRRTALVVRAQSSQSEPQFGLAPAKPKTAYGEMLQYYLTMEPQLFQSAVDSQLQRLHAEKEAKAAQDAARKSQEEEEAEAAGAEGAADGSKGPERSKSDLVLYQRMEEIRASEVRATLEDLMYVSILEKFLLLGVEMLPRLDGFVDPGPANLMALTEGIHSKEALELVREHMLGVMGAAASNKFSTELIKMSKFQMAQVYAASIMFGYFLRRVDKRFQLESSLGILSEPEDAVARLERLFAQADDMGTASDPDAPGPIVDILSSLEELDAASSSPAPAGGDSSGSSSRADSGAGASTSSRASSASEQEKGGSAREFKRSSSSRARSALRKYIEGFDQVTMIETARVVSAEGAALVERQTTALFGDIKALTKQMQEAVGSDISSAEELYARIQQAVQTSAIETVTMTIAVQRRCVLEAVAFGTFLRDVETNVQGEYNLLTPLAPPKRLSGSGPGSEEGDSDDDDDGGMTSVQ